MFQRSIRSRSRAISADIGEIEHRLRTLEKHLERIGGNTSRNAALAVDRMGETADRVAETVASALGTMADRFRGKASSVSDQAGKMGNVAGTWSCTTGNAGGFTISQIEVTINGWNGKFSGNDQFCTYNGNFGGIRDVLAKSLGGGIAPIAATL